MIQLEDTAIELYHPTMVVQIGVPAVLQKGDVFPSLKVTPSKEGVLRAAIVELRSRTTVAAISEFSVAEAKQSIVTFPGNIFDEGSYRIEVELSNNEQDVERERYYFTVIGERRARSSKAAFLGSDNRLVYVPDYRGNRLPDFSGVGYKGGSAEIPEVPNCVEVEPVSGDATAVIQEAIDRVSQLPVREDGLRGAVLLKRGVYEIGTFLEIKASGVVLRGEGQGDFNTLWHDPDTIKSLKQLKDELQQRSATVLIATGGERRRLINVSGSSGADRLEQTVSEIIDSYVPVGTKAFHIENPERFQVGDQILVQRSGNEAWINEIGMNRIPPRADGGSIPQWSPFELEFEHTIIAIDGNRITVDSSIQNAIEKRWGGGRIFKFQEPGRIEQVGVEQLRAISFWLPNADGVDDTRHSDGFLDFDHIRDAWVKNVTVEHFNGTNGAFRTGRGSKRITIQDSSTLVADKKFYNGKGYDPTGRTFYETKVYVGRYGFHLVGQLALVQRCFALNNRHGFTLGSRVCGPNVFLDCIGEKPLTWSEPHHRWSVGGLYDNVHDMISLMNRLNMGSGHGWAGANYVAWNTEGTLVAQQPPTAQNWAIGHIGKKDAGGNRGPDGLWDSFGEHVEPRSLCLQQLKERLDDNISG